MLHQRVEIEGGHLRILPTTDNKFLNGNTHEKPSPFLVFGFHLAGKGDEDRAVERVLHDEQVPNCRK